MTARCPFCEAVRFPPSPNPWANTSTAPAEPPRPLGSPLSLGREGHPSERRIGAQVASLALDSPCSSSGSPRKTERRKREF